MASVSSRKTPIRASPANEDNGDSVGRTVINNSNKARKAKTANSRARVSNPVANKPASNRVSAANVARANADNKAKAKAKHKEAK